MCTSISILVLDSCIQNTCNIKTGMLNRINSSLKPHMLSTVLQHSLALKGCDWATGPCAPDNVDEAF